MPPWNTASAKRSKTTRRRFPTKRANRFTIRRRVGSFIIPLEFTYFVRQASGRSSSILPQNISSCSASLDNPTCGFMTSDIRKNHEGDAECRLITSDQVVVWQGMIREKPENAEEARTFLRGYAEAPAETVTAVVVTNTAAEGRRQAVDRATVWFRRIPEEIIAQVIARRE